MTTPNLHLLHLSICNKGTCQAFILIALLFLNFFLTFLTRPVVARCAHPAAAGNRGWPSVATYAHPTPRNCHAPHLALDLNHNEKVLCTLYPMKHHSSSGWSTATHSLRTVYKVLTTPPAVHVLALSSLPLGQQRPCPTADPCPDG